MKDANKQDILLPHLDSISNLVKRCAEDQDKSDELHKTVVGLIGDLGTVFGARMVHFLTDHIIIKTVQEGLADEDINELSRWTMTVSCLLSLLMRS
jgi:importin subunit beta-1